MREMLEWGGDMEASMGSTSEEAKPSVSQVLEALKDNPGTSEIMIYVFPEGNLKIVPSGTTAANIIHEEVPTLPPPLPLPSFLYPLGGLD